MMHEKEEARARRILVTDSSGEMREELVRLLDERGSVVELADTCMAAVRCLARRNYDCIILESALEDGSGLDIFRVLISPAPHVFLFTAEDFSADGRRAVMRMGVEKIFIKPGETRELVDCVAACDCGWQDEDGSDA